MRDFIRRCMANVIGPVAGRNVASPADISAQLELHHSPELLDQLFAFGQVMLDEVQSRTTAIESKATSMFGWTTGLLALFVLQPPKAIADLTTSELVLTIIGVAGAAAGLFASALALRVQSFSWPSQRDWLRADLFSGDVWILRSLHVLAMLETHEKHACVNELKARHLQIAQAGLLVAGLSLGLQLIVALAFRALGVTP